ncbi:hypothetical protein [Nitrosomonas sp. Nm166]|uniref:hypothetical protein n=1 Tax=Nitrosomonas sp. Nm166 TaxID=1881054 RepID=UPI0008DF988A|nr:hypothetical protein [Nitrosomonas sp. Nm166]SFF03855.1 hypothetical protein SAMN05428977_104421 [Nitrosomonas sp. Nm166]
MINIRRHCAVPASLTSQEIKDYINQVLAYLNGEQPTEPEKPGTYRTSDLLEAFDECFFSKCYLTEEKFENSWAMDIDHFLPQKDRPDLIYDWNNLFPAGHYANMTKPRKYPPGGYLNPCDPTDDVEKEILYTLLPLDKPNFSAKDINNIKAVNTARLLDIVHNGSNNNGYQATATLRHFIHKKENELLNTIIEWKDLPENSDDKHHVEVKLKRMLSRKSSFTMLCRSIAAVRRYIPKEFLD